MNSRRLHGGAARPNRPADKHSSQSLQATCVWAAGFPFSRRAAVSEARSASRLTAPGHDRPRQRRRGADSRGHERRAGDPRGKKPEFRQVHVSSCATPGAWVHSTGRAARTVGSTSTLRVIAMREKQSQFRRRRPRASRLFSDTTSHARVR